MYFCVWWIVGAILFVGAYIVSKIVVNWQQTRLPCTSEDLKLAEHKRSATVQRCGGACNGSNEAGCTTAIEQGSLLNSSTPIATRVGDAASGAPTNCCPYAHSMAHALMFSHLPVHNLGHS